MFGYLKAAWDAGASAIGALLLLLGYSSEIPVEIAVDFSYSGEHYRKAFPATARKRTWGFMGESTTWDLTPTDISVVLTDGSTLVMAPNQWLWNQHSRFIPLPEAGSSIEARVYDWIWLNRLPGASRALRPKSLPERKGPFGEGDLIHPDDAVTATITRLESSETVAAIKGSRRLQEDRLRPSGRGTEDTGRGVLFAEVPGAYVVGTDSGRLTALRGWVQKEPGCRALYSAKDNVRIIGDVFLRARKVDLIYRGNGQWETPAEASELHQAFAISSVDIQSYDFYDRQPIRQSVGGVRVGGALCALGGWDSGYVAVWPTDSESMLILGDPSPVLILREGG